MNNHTKEPWAYDGQSGIGATGSDQFNDGYFTCEVMGPDKEHNARRIVACVNACKGLATDDLEQRGLVSAVGCEILRIEQQRDDLLEALNDCVESLKIHNPYWSTDRDNIVGFAEKIIAEVEGKNDLS